MDPEGPIWNAEQKRKNTTKQSLAPAVTEQGKERK